MTGLLLMLLAIDRTGVPRPATTPTTVYVQVADGGTIGVTVGSTSVDGGRVSIDNFPASYAVTGTFWQASQPVNGAVHVDGGQIAVTNWPASQAVTGTFWQSVQPVSGSIHIDAGQIQVTNFPATQAVTGTFFQSTQPVSGSIHIDAGQIQVTNFPASQAVTGTFWQTTQPVSGSVNVFGQVVVDGGYLTVSQSGAWSNNVFGQVTVDGGYITASQSGAWSVGAYGQVTVDGGYLTASQSGTWTVQPGNTANTTPWLVSMPGNVTVDGGRIDNNIVLLNGVAPLMGTGATGTGSLRVTLATNSPGFSTANGTIAADSVLQARRAVAYGSSPTPVTAGNHGPAIGDLEGIPYVNNGHPRSVLCQMAAATTATLLELTGCAAVASNSYYIKSVVMTGGIANAATVPGLLRSGTGTNCGTGTVTLATCWHGTAGSCAYYFDPPIKATASHAICAIDATVGTKSVMLTGYVAP